MTTLRNFCYHTLIIYGPSGEPIRKIPSEGTIRANLTISEFEIDGIPCVDMHYDGVMLPEIGDDEYLVVSRVVSEALGKHPKVLCPDTSPASVVRDTNGQVIGVRRLRR